MNQTISAILDYLKTNLSNPIAGSIIQWSPSSIHIVVPSMQSYINIIITTDTKANIIIDGIYVKQFIIKDRISKQFIINAHQPNLLEQTLTAIYQIIQLHD